MSDKPLCEIRSQIYVAQSNADQRYTFKMLTFLMGESAWMEAAQPSVEEVKRQLTFIASRRPIWTNDINDADIWGDYTIEKYGKYLDDVTFKPVNLKVE